MQFCVDESLGRSRTLLCKHAVFGCAAVKVWNNDNWQCWSLANVSHSKFGSSEFSCADSTCNLTTALWTDVPTAAVIRVTRKSALSLSNNAATWSKLRVQGLVILRLASQPRRKFSWGPKHQNLRAGPVVLLRTSGSEPKEVRGWAGPSREAGFPVATSPICTAATQARCQCKSFVVLRSSACMTTKFWAVFFLPKCFQGTSEGIEELYAPTRVCVHAH